MAKKVAGIGVEISLDMEQFNKDLKTAQKNAQTIQKSLQNEMKENKLNYEVDTNAISDSGFLNKIKKYQTEIGYLTNQISAQQKKVETAKITWQGVSKATGENSAQTVKASLAYAAEEAKLSQLMKAKRNATQQMNGEFKGALLGTVGTVLAVGSAFVLTAEKVIEASMKWTEGVREIARVTGMSGEDASKLTGVMSIVGIDAEQGAGLLARLNEKLKDAKKSIEDAKTAGTTSKDPFTQNSIKILDNNGELLKYPQIFANISKELALSNTDLEKNLITMDLVGMKGRAIQEFFEMSGGEIKEYEKRLQELGLVFSGDTLQKFEDFNRELNLTKTAINGVLTELSSAGLDPAEDVLKGVQESLKWILENKDGLIATFEGIGWIVKETAKPFLIMKDGLALLIEQLNKYLKIKKEKDAAANTDNETKQAEAAAKAAQKQAEAEEKAADIAIKKLKEKNLKMLDDTKKLSDEIAKINGDALELRLNEIEKEKKAWIIKTEDELKATELAEKQKTKAIKDEVYARFGEEVRAVKEAKEKGEDVEKAYYEAHQKRLRDEENLDYAKNFVYQKAGGKIAGTTSTQLVSDYETGTITQKQIVETENKYPDIYKLNPNYRETPESIYGNKNITITAQNVDLQSPTQQLQTTLNQQQQQQQPNQTENKNISLNAPITLNITSNTDAPEQMAAIAQAALKVELNELYNKINA